MVKVADVKLVMKSTVGITSYIHNSLMQGRQFSPPGHPGGIKRAHCSKSMSIGRHTDRAFQKIVTGKVTDGLMSTAVTRARNMATMLASINVRVCCVQVPVSYDALGIHTRLDALGVNSRGELVVIELKTSQKTARVHRATRDAVCRNQQVMVNGVANSEHNHHMLQTGFGMLALRQSYPAFVDYNIRGVVITACSDNVYSIDVPLLFAAMSLFKAPHLVKRQRPRCTRSKPDLVSRHLVRWTAPIEANVAKTHSIRAVCRRKHYYRTFCAGTARLNLCILRSPWHKLSASNRKLVASKFPRSTGIVAVVLSPTPDNLLEMVRIRSKSV
jgi:hypothetical protein